MPFVMFDVYTAHALGLNGTDAEALAVILDQLAAIDLAGRIRYGLENNALVTLDPDDREVLMAALDTLVANGADQPEQASTLAGNIRARAAGADIPPPRIK